MMFGGELDGHGGKVRTCSLPEARVVPRRLNSDEIGKASLGLTEAVDAKPQKEAGDHRAHRQIGQMEWTLATENAPAEAVNNTHHRVEGIEEPPLFGDDTRAEPDR